MTLRCTIFSLSSLVAWWPGHQLLVFLLLQAPPVTLYDPTTQGPRPSPVCTARASPRSARAALCPAHSLNLDVARTAPTLKSHDQVSCFNRSLLFLQVYCSSISSRSFLTPPRWTSRSFISNPRRFPSLFPFSPANHALNRAFRVSSSCPRNGPLRGRSRVSLCSSACGSLRSHLLGPYYVSRIYYTPETWQWTRYSVPTPEELRIQ